MNRYGNFNILSISESQICAIILTQFQNEILFFNLPSNLIYFLRILWSREKLEILSLAVHDVFDVTIFYQSSSEITSIVIDTSECQNSKKKKVFWKTGR